jgi:lysophospholipase L1-like esterase
MILRAAWQALRIAVTAPRLPEAAGPRAGRAGAGPALRLFILGDSSAAGVGVAHQDQALAGQLVAALAREFDVLWQLDARSGRTTRAARKLALSPRADAVVVALGVNDVITPGSVTRWLRDYTALAQGLGASGARLYLTGVPPLGRFPLLPDPLRSLLGARAARFDAALAAVAAQWPNVRHLPVDPGLLDAETMASDGFHPGLRAHALWGAALAETIRGDFQPSGSCQCAAISP